MNVDLVMRNFEAAQERIAQLRNLGWRPGQLAPFGAPSPAAPAAPGGPAAVDGQVADQAEVERLTSLTVLGRQVLHERDGSSPEAIARRERVDAGELRRLIGASRLGADVLRRLDRQHRREGR